MKKKLIILPTVVILGFFCTFGLLTNVVYALEPSSNEIYRGIDVSAYQREIDYVQVKNAGIEVVYIKSSEGTTLRDPYFERNYTNAKANGLKVGFYHFVRARTEEEAIKEAQFFSSVIAGKNPDCRLAMDFEVFGNLTKEEINRIGKVFLNETEKLTGKQMVVYSNTYTARTIWDLEIAKQYPLWVAQYGREVPQDNGKWNNWVGFQYSDMGNIPGINGYVDLNRFTRQILLGDTGEIPKPEQPNVTQYYIVQKGDTLSQIAIWYQTTVEELVRLNQIKNPNLIYPGQKLIVTTSDNPNKEKKIMYQVKRGDTLWGIARRFGTTINRIVAENQIVNPNLIYPGQQLVIEVANNTSQEQVSGVSYYTIKRGDTLWGIARKFGTNVSQLVSWNRIVNPNRIYSGQTIIVRKTTDIARNNEETHSCGHTFYRVKRTDTLAKIAKYYGVSIQSIINENQIANPNRIYVGQILRICNMKSST